MITTAVVVTADADLAASFSRLLHHHHHHTDPAENLAIYTADSYGKDCALVLKCNPACCLVGIGGAWGDFISDFLLPVATERPEFRALFFTGDLRADLVTRDWMVRHWEMFDRVSLGLFEIPTEIDGLQQAALLLL